MTKSITRILAIIYTALIFSACGLPASSSLLATTTLVQSSTIDEHASSGNTNQNNYDDSGWPIYLLDEIDYSQPGEKLHLNEPNEAYFSGRAGDELYIRDGYMVSAMLFTEYTRDEVDDENFVPYEGYPYAQHYWSLILTGPEYVLSNGLHVGMPYQKALPIMELYRDVPYNLDIATVAAAEDKYKINGYQIIRWEMFYPGLFDEYSYVLAAWVVTEARYSYGLCIYFDSNDCIAAITHTHLGAG